MSVDKTLAERGSRYGAFADHARIAQGVQDVMRAAPKWDHLDQDMKQALSVIADKIARILNGDPFYGDNWHDIQGYAKLIEDRIEMISSEEDTPFEPSENPDRGNVTVPRYATGQAFDISNQNASIPSFKEFLDKYSANFKP